MNVYEKRMTWTYKVSAEGAICFSYNANKMFGNAYRKDYPVVENLRRSIAYTSDLIQTNMDEPETDEYEFVRVASEALKTMSDMIITHIANATEVK